MKFKRFDVMIVGTGISGIYAALNLDPSLNILMLSKRELTLCNSALAQGGVAAVMDSKNDDYELHIKDTLIAGQYKNNLDNVKILVEQGPKDVERLVEKYGVDFDRNADGSLALTLEGGHSRRRIAHHKDTTGFEIETSLIEQVQKLTNVTVINNSVLRGRYHKQCRGRRTPSRILLHKRRYSRDGRYRARLRLHDKLRDSYGRRHTVGV